jgi:predicted nucleotide-binding protein
MNTAQDELLAIADRESTLSTAFDDASIKDPLDAMETAAQRVGKAWSGSWLGYQSLVYYDRLEPPPAGAHFSSEWGFENMGWIDGATTGDWREFPATQIETRISELSRNSDLEPARELVAGVAKQFENDKSEVASLLSVELSRSSDPYLESLKVELDKLRILSKALVVNTMRPSGQIMSRDSLAFTQGLRVPPHIEVLAEVYALRQPKIVCEQLSILARKAGSHIGRKSRRRNAETTGTNVFIGHGRSLLWRELKDFVDVRLRLPWDEFNRVPVAGVTNIARLSEMLDAAAIAFLLVTGEDELKDGTMQARMNVVHEAGLFQGKLGFTKAIILLEEGCEEFSNIQGLGQIRFPKGNIQAAFEEIRRVLEREEILGVNAEANHDK